MKEYLWRKFVKDYENYKDPEVRGRYTKLTGTLGIVVNSVLCVVKIILGLGIHSIAVVADGAHDMADSVAASAPTAPNMQIDAPTGGFDEGQSGELPFEI